MMERWVQGILCALFAYISLVPYYYLQGQNLTQEVPAFSLTKYLPFVLVGLGLLIWMGGLAKRSRKVFRSPVYPFMVAYLGLSLCSLLGADHARLGLVKWIYYNTTGCILCLLVMQYCRSWQDVRRVARLMASVSGVVVLYTILAVLWGDDPLWGKAQSTYNPYYTQHRATGPFGHTVATASYVMFFIPLALWMWLAVGRLSWKVVWGTVCALYIPVILLTQTRGALLATGVCIVLIAPWLKREGRVLGGIDRRNWAIRAGVALAALLAIGRGLEVDRLATDRLVQIKERWRHILEQRSITIRDGDKEYHYGSLLEYTERFRIAQYHTVGNILEEHPVLGVGFGTFTRAFDQFKYTESYMEREFPEHTTENMYLMFLAETGWAGLVSQLALMGTALVMVFRAYRRSAHGEQRNFLLAYLSGAGGLTFNMLTWDILNEPTLRMSYWMLTGLALAASSVVNVRPAQNSPQVLARSN